MGRTITFRNRIEKLSYISKFIHDKFTAAESGFIVHEIDLQRLYKSKMK